MFSRIVSAFRSKPKAASKPTIPAVEGLEHRTFFHASATSIITDNRAELQITFSEALDPATVNTRSVFVFAPGVDGINGNADDVKIDGIVRLKTGNRRVWFRPRVPVPFAAGTTYMVKLNSSRMKGQDGHRIDGEFNGAGLATGNGTEAGDLIFLSKRDKGTVPVARFSTVAGNIDVNLFSANTPITVANFLHYANNGLWDYTYFHRAASLDANTQFVIQGGGFNASLTDNTATGLTKIPTIAPILNEPGISNTRGTIAMAKTSAPNSATDQWFFNETDANTFLDDPNNPNNTGGFTVFGTIKNGLAVMDTLGALTRKDLSQINNPDPQITGAMDETPVINPSATAPNLAPLTDLAIVRRVAILNKVSAFVAPA